MCRVIFLTQFEISAFGKYDGKNSVTVFETKTISGKQKLLSMLLMVEERETSSTSQQITL